MEVSKKFISKFLVFTFVLLLTEFAFLTNNKQAGIPFLRELFSFVLLAVSFYFIFLKRYWMSSRYEVYIVFYVFSWLVLSSVLAYFSHGQPVYYGMFEERRVLLFLSFFPIFYLLLRGITDFDQLGRYLLIAFIFTTLIGVFYSLGIFSPKIDVSFSVGGRSLEDIQEVYEGFRGGRFTIGTNFIVWMFCFSLIAYRESGKILWLIVGVYIFWYTWHVVQTRTLLAIIALCTVIIFRKRLDRLFVGGYFLIFFCVSAVLIFPDWIVSQIDKFDMLLSDVLEHSGPRTREITISIILEEVFKNPFGYGALSLQWNNGFMDIYNDNFYLSDVGIFGVVYRFGLMSVPMILMFYYLYCSRAWALRKDVYPLVISACYVVWISVANFVFSSSMAMSGNLFGALLAVLAARIILLRFQEEKIEKEDVYAKKYF